MSMHRKPLTELERAGLEAHGLEIGTPSQLSDAFRQGVAWAMSQEQGKVISALQEMVSKEWCRSAMSDQGYESAKECGKCHWCTARSMLAGLTPTPKTVKEAWVMVADQLPEVGQAIAVPRRNCLPPFAGVYSPLDGQHRCLDRQYGKWWEFDRWVPLPEPEKA